MNGTKQKLFDKTYWVFEKIVPVRLLGTRFTCSTVQLDWFVKGQVVCGSRCDHSKRVVESPWSQASNSGK
jgi:hypothetical protein